MKFEEFFKGAAYVSAREGYHSPYIRKGFTLHGEVALATLAVSALGFVELYVNGKRIHDDLYVTPYSQYNAQTPSDISPSCAKDSFFNDEVRYSIYVSEFDVTQFLLPSENAFGAVIAGGWYRSNTDKYGNYRDYGRTKLCFRLTVRYTDGREEAFVSDGSCKWKESFLTDSGVYHEEQDETLEIKDFSLPTYDDTAWNAVEVVETPNSDYKKNDCPPQKIIRYVTPTLVKETESGKIYDAGENLTGYPIICSGEEGDEIECVYSEALDENGELDENHIYMQTTRFKTDGRKEHFLRFTWHGFRYFRLTSKKGAKLFVERVAVVHTDVENTSEFASDNELLNWIYKTYIHTQQLNYQCGVPTDCPQIERKAYTGDGQLLSECGMMMFDSKALYRKWLRDISDCQDAKTGFVHNTAPCFVGCAGGVGGWGAAIINVPYFFYQFFGEKSVLDEYYPQMKKYLEFVHSERVDGLVLVHKRLGWHIGDWESPFGRDGLLPTDFVNTCLCIAALEKAIEIARICEKEEDIPEYEKRIEEFRKAVDRKFLDEKTGDYCENMQGANALAINAGLGDMRTVENLKIRYGELKHFDSGIFATKTLMKVLMEQNAPEVAYGLLTSTHEISFNTWKESGATTLYESWKNARSLNHPMFGSVTQYFFEYFLGIRQTKGGVGYQKVLINPLKVDALKTLSGSLQTASGKIAVAIERGEDGARFVVEIPTGVEATFLYEGYTQILTAGKNEIAL